MKKVTLFIVLFVSMFWYFSSRILATSLFYDDFSSSDMVKWKQLSIGDTTWNVVDNRLKSESWYRQQSYILAKNTFGLSDYAVDVDVENVSGIDQHFIFRAKEDLSEFYQIELRYPDSGWPQDPASNLRMWKYKNGGYARLINDTYYPLSKGKVFHLRIAVQGSNIKIYIDGNLVVDKTDDVDTITSGGAGLHSYAGEYRPKSVINYYDNFSISTIGQVQNKIIILPGLGASWNTQAFVYGQQVADDQWKMTPFAHNYDGLINALTKNGLVKDKDFFVWNYDWRRPASEIVNKLDTFINSNIGSSEKVDLVGHSFGGVIARIWGQDHLTNPRLGKIVTLGSPHSGAMVAYDWWNGAKTVAGGDPAQVALAMVYQLNRRNTQNDVEVLRNFAPSLKDLLPTFNFIVRNNNLVNSSTLTTKNDYLKSKNLEASTVFDNLKTIVGVGQSTSERIMVGERTVFDKVLGRWPDGAPLKYVLGQGDGTVIKNSAKFEGDAFEEVNSDHGKIVDKGINNVLAELGIGGTSNEPVYDLSNKWIFFIGSPAYLQVKCGNNSPIVSDDLGFVVASGSDNECLVNIVGTSNGTYHLVTGKTNDQNSWQYFEETIGVGQSKVLVINNAGPKVDPLNLDYFYGLVRYDLAKLQSTYSGNVNLVTAMSGANNKNVNNLMFGLFNFRKEKKESLISGAIIKNLEIILAIENRNLSLTAVKAAYTKAIQDKSLVDRITRLNVVMGKSPTSFGAESYKKMEEFLNQNGLQYGKSVLASKLAAEVW